MRWPGPAWTIANLYLGGIDAKLLSEDVGVLTIPASSFS